MTESIEMRGPTMEVNLGKASDAYEAAAFRARAERWAERLHERDATLWSTDGRVQEAIADRLGWLDAPDHFEMLIPSIEAFSSALRDEGFVAAIVAGMGGSSLAPDVLNRTFGSEGWVAVRVLDSTDPEAVAAVVDDLDPLATLFIVATKSGTTTEPHAFLADAWDRLEKAIEARDASGKPGDLVVAITDRGRSLDAIPHHNDFRELFLNPPDIGGRYSALTYVGLVPAGLMGLDLDPLLASAQAMLASTHDNDPARNPGLELGIAIGTLAVNGRDKLTFVADPEIASFGAWLEQLIAESTGKHGVGIVPVDMEPLGSVDAYRSDRVFVRLALDGATAVAATPDGRPADELLADLSAAGHPVIRIEIPDPIDLGGEFVRWEVATAIAGIVLGIDPFDQPNVEEAKERTRELLEKRDASDAEVPQDNLPGAWSGSSETAVALPSSVPILATEMPIVLVGDTPMQLTHGDGTAAGELRRHLARLRPSGYIALQAYIAPTPARDAAFARIRTLLRDATRNATTVGYGPRFLHSTGQLHKGGPATGWFLQLTADHPKDRPIPDWPYTFGELIEAQAEGDFQAIEAHELPILRVHLGPDPDEGLATLERLLVTALQAGATVPGDGGTHA